MIRLVLAMVMLFSFTVTAENLKYKRDAYNNMGMHIKCYALSVKSGFTEARSDTHFDEFLVYASLSWVAISQRLRDGYKSFEAYAISKQKYGDGYVDGITAAGIDDKGISDLYYKYCLEGVLLFAASK